MKKTRMDFHIDEAVRSLWLTESEVSRLRAFLTSQSKGWIELDGVWINLDKVGLIE